jgi:hypothetical protein
MSDHVIPDDFLDRVRAALDWASLAPWIEAIEAKLGTPVPIALCKMVLLERWFQLSSAELDDACHARPAFRRFLDAPLHGPVAEVWMHRQFAPKLAAAGPTLGKLITAAEMMLADRHIAPPTCAWTHPDQQLRAPPNEGTRTTVFEPGRLAALAAQAEAEALADAGEEDAGLPPALQPRAAAILLWPWSGASRLDVRLRIGRDPEFSPLARQLWADPRISRRHAELSPVERGVVIRDLGSSNGSYVDDARLAPDRPILLRHDAQLRFGPLLQAKLAFFPDDLAPDDAFPVLTAKSPPVR